MDKYKLVPVAWIRKWSLDGEKPTKERNKSGRMAIPMKYKLHEVTRNRCLPDDVALYAHPQPTEQQPVQDASALVEALESLIKGYVGLLEAGKDRITSLGGDCDPVPVMERNDPWLRDARAALAAYYKGEQP